MQDRTTLNFSERGFGVGMRPFTGKFDSLVIFAI
jgi:hypothetical protein